VLTCPRGYHHSSEWRATQPEVFEVWGNGDETCAVSQIYGNRRSYAVLLRSRERSMYSCLALGVGYGLFLKPAFIISRGFHGGRGTRHVGQTGG